MNDQGEWDTIGQHTFGELFAEHMTGLQIKVVADDEFTAYCVTEAGVDEEQQDAVCRALSHATRQLLLN